MEIVIKILMGITVVIGASLFVIASISIIMHFHRWLHKFDHKLQLVRFVEEDMENNKEI